ncbi:MAG: hypothetical protein EZS28_003012 [Streblomastix strix]|uniref:Uncharacterized protein n=1 Tax=Streblomastix strix TaxID=222440 RepID=A0A5J4X337_9EUKA|nr:MAG: hypothetical protein EZS28_003012 [Streblomastix strix]
MTQSVATFEPEIADFLERIIPHGNKNNSDQKKKIPINIELATKKAQYLYLHPLLIPQMIPSIPKANYHNELISQKIVKYPKPYNGKQIARETIIEWAPNTTCIMLNTRYAKWNAFICVDLKKNVQNKTNQKKH